MNNKQEIDWHEDCYKNWKQSLDKHEERTLKELEKIKSDRQRLDFYRFQINEAVKEGKGEFDRDKYKVKRKPQTSPLATSAESPKSAHD